MHSCPILHGVTKDHRGERLGYSSYCNSEVFIKRCLVVATLTNVGHSDELLQNWQDVFTWLCRLFKTWPHPSSHPDRAGLSCFFILHIYIGKGGFFFFKCSLWNSPCNRNVFTSYLTPQWLAMFLNFCFKWLEWVVQEHKQISTVTSLFSLLLKTMDSDVLGDEEVDMQSCGEAKVMNGR